MPNAAAIAEAMREHGEEVLLDLLTITAPGYPVERLTPNTTNITSGGNTFTAYPFTVGMPDDSKQSQSSVQITIGNIDRRLIEILRTIPGPIPMTLSKVLASSPNTIQWGPYDLLLKSHSITATAITGQLSYGNKLQRKWPGYSFTPKRNPGLFGRTE